MGITSALKRHFWPISAMVFCPCHLPLSMSALAGATAGTTLGGVISAHYTSIESVLAVSFSFYFVLAFMIWAVRGPQASNTSTACKVEPGSERPAGMSTRQIVLWGIVGMLTMPLLIAGSLFVQSDVLPELIESARTMSSAGGSGLIWLVSLSTVVMIPVMIIWLVWMWIAWSKVDPEQAGETWHYEYD